jgi:hypothetical protein
MEKAKEDEINASKPPPGFNNNSIKYATQKFEKEYWYICKAILLDEEEENVNHMNETRSLEIIKMNYVKLG